MACPVPLLMAIMCCCVPAAQAPSVSFSWLRKLVGSAWQCADPILTPLGSVSASVAWKPHGICAHPPPWAAVLSMMPCSKLVVSLHLHPGGSSASRQCKAANRVQPLDQAATTLAQLYQSRWRSQQLCQSIVMSTAREALSNAAQDAPAHPPIITTADGRGNAEQQDCTVQHSSGKIHVPIHV